MGRPVNPASIVHSICPTCLMDFTFKSWKPKTFCSKKCACNSPEVKMKNATGVKSTFDKTYGGHPMAINEDTKSKFKQSMVESHGVDHPSKMSGFVDKVKMTKLDRYGNPNYNHLEKMKSTMLERYGVDNYRKTDAYDEKVKLTSMQKYGVPYPAQSDDIQNSRKELMFQKFLTSSRFENFIYKFKLSDYTGVDMDSKKYPFECIRCGQIELHNLSDGRAVKCSKCDKRTISFFQEGVVDFVQSLFPQHPILINDRTILFPRELDIYLQHKHIAIETDGIFYHSEVSGKKNKTYHIHKTSSCITKGIRLLHVFENEWNQKREIVKSVLKNILGADGVVISGRKTIVREIDPSVKSKFLVENHLQGNDHSTVKIGLFYGDKLVSVMTFVKSRFDKKLEWEMSRFCNLLGHRIHGGAAKMFSYFIKTYNPKSIVSYCDRRYFGGEVYLKLGMTFVSNTPPNYYYIIDKYDTLRNRISWQKAKLKDKLESFDPSKTEWENMQEHGFDRIWDCGSLKFVWKKPIAPHPANDLHHTP